MLLHRHKEMSVFESAMPADGTIAARSPRTVISACPALGQLAAKLPSLPCMGKGFAPACSGLSAIF
jgi:hypothetical protein